MEDNVYRASTSGQPAIEAQQERTRREEMAKEVVSIIKSKGLTIEEAGQLLQDVSAALKKCKII